MLVDTSVLRNFGILGWVNQLVALAGGTVYVVHGVMGLHSDEQGEIEAIRTAFEEESLRHPGTPAASAATVAVVGLDALLARRSSDIAVLSPTVEEFAVAVRLQDRAERSWRESLGVKARRLDPGEAVSVTVATGRGFTFASDDDDARIAYLALSGSRHLWTLDLIQQGVVWGLLDEATARAGYEDLRQRYRFWGPPWP